MVRASGSSELDNLVQMHYFKFMKNENNLVRELNGYRVIYQPKHHRAMTNKNWSGFVYEHIIIAEESLGRKLQENEVVHHLNGDRSNNRSANLLVVDRSQHAKLHMWLSSGAPFKETERKNGENSLKANFEDPQFCKCCGKTLQLKQKTYCSMGCSSLYMRRVKRPDKKQLEQDLKAMSLLAIGRKYCVSDNAVRKWLKSYSLIKPTMSRAFGTPKEGAETTGGV